MNCRDGIRLPCSKEAIVDSEYPVRAPSSAPPDGVRLEVSDTRSERLPEARPPQDPADDESGRGLLLVGALAERWGVEPRSPGKCVWADVRPSPATPR